MRPRDRRAFTLLELVVATGISAVVLGIALPSFSALLFPGDVARTARRLAALIAGAQARAVRTGVAHALELAPGGGALRMTRSSDRPVDERSGGRYGGWEPVGEPGTELALGAVSVDWPRTLVVFSCDRTSSGAAVRISGPGAALDVHVHAVTGRVSIVAAHEGSVR